MTQPPLAKLPPEAGMQAKCEEEEVGGRGGGGCKERPGGNVGLEGRE